MDDTHTTFSDPAAPPDDSDAVLGAMVEAVDALRRFSDHTPAILDAFERAAKARENGSSYEELATEDRLFVDFASGQFRELYDAFSALRRKQARALYDEGMTMAQLGRLLGVTRQRIAVLLANSKPAPSND